MLRRSQKFSLKAIELEKKVVFQLLFLYGSFHSSSLCKDDEAEFLDLRFLILLFDPENAIYVGYDFFCFTHEAYAIFILDDSVR